MVSESSSELLEITLGAGEGKGTAGIFVGVAVSSSEIESLGSGDSDRSSADSTVLLAVIAIGVGVGAGIPFLAKVSLDVFEIAGSCDGAGVIPGGKAVAERERVGLSPISLELDGAGEGSNVSAVSFVDPSETTLPVDADPSATKSLELNAEGIDRGDFVRLFNGVTESTPSPGGSEYNGIDDN